MDANPIGIHDENINQVYYDSRKILVAQGALFFALEGPARSGSAYIEDAYQKGVRSFVVCSDATLPIHADAVYLQVADTLEALQQLAKHHRAQFSYPVVAITGSVGKTTFKEWASHCLADRFQVVRSPKSYNSQLGVALSLLEMHHQASIALIEAGISKPGEMQKLAEMIQPDFGVFTAFGTAHRENFTDKEAHLFEKLSLFSQCKLVFVPQEFETFSERLPSNFQLCKPQVDAALSHGFQSMQGVLRSFLAFLQYPTDQINTKLAHLPHLALRMEVFDGINNNIVINDTYNLDQNALTEALMHQQQLAGNRKRIVVIGLSNTRKHEQESIAKTIETFHPDEVHFIDQGKSIPWNAYHDAVVLVKAHRDRAFEQEVAKGRKLTHRTFVEINLSAIKHNVAFYQSRLPKSVQILAMVKAASYGAGAEKVATVLEQSGISYFGVAFADEGIELRNSGIRSTIVVMNPDPEHSDSIIDNQLEPAIYSFEQLDEFITTLIHRQVTNYPIHLKFDTGMHRLGFDPSDKERVLAIIHAQPEVRIQGIYSHLADADNPNQQDFTLKQLSVFDEIVSYFRAHYAGEFLAHVLNSEGALRYASQHYDMVRLGISMYGYTENLTIRPHLQASVSWYSAVSQIKKIPKDDSVGYGCTYQARDDMNIAIVPVGYADGFRRSLSNGVGSVYIHGKRCAVVGRVCMDMIMVDVTGLAIQPNDRVEIIGENQSMEAFAQSMNTIPYEVMTSLSKRMQRLYIEE